VNEATRGAYLATEHQAAHAAALAADHEAAQTEATCNATVAAEIQRVRIAGPLQWPASNMWGWLRALPNCRCESTARS